MKTLYLIRHGETIWNCQSKTQGCRNIGLSVRGFIQGKLLADRIEKLNDNYVKIYSSDLDRCYETAKLIDERINVGIEVVRDLREINFGDWEGLTTDEIKTFYLNEFNKWRNRPHKALIPGGEDLKTVQNRCLKIIKRILNKYNKGAIIVISHSVAIRTIILGLLDIELSHFYKIVQSNACINKIEFRSYGPVLVSLNDTNHLDIDVCS
jgi:probable phosphoglycerate mutase